MITYRHNIVSQSTGCSNPLLFEEIYEYYARAEAWYVAPGAQAALQRLRDSGMSCNMIYRWLAKGVDLLAVHVAICFLRF